MVGSQRRLLEVEVGGFAPFWCMYVHPLCSYTAILVAPTSGKAHCGLPNAIIACVLPLQRAGVAARCGLHDFYPDELGS